MRHTRAADSSAQGVADFRVSGPSGVRTVSTTRPRARNSPQEKASAPPFSCTSVRPRKASIKSLVELDGWKGPRSLARAAWRQTTSDMMMAETADRSGKTRRLSKDDVPPKVELSLRRLVV